MLLLLLGQMFECVFHSLLFSGLKEEGILRVPGNAGRVKVENPPLLFMVIAQCWFNIQRFLCTVIKFQVVNEAIQSLSSSAFITNFNLFVIIPLQYSNDKTLNQLFIPLFQGRNPMSHCQFSSVPT